MDKPCNMNEKLFTNPLLEKLKGHDVKFKAALVSVTKSVQDPLLSNGVNVVGSLIL